MKPFIERLEDRTTPAAVLNTTYSGINVNQGGFVPPDTSGAVGPACFVETTNQAIALFTPKGTGTSVVRTSLGNFMFTTGGLPRADGGSFQSDPIVTYDSLIGRFIVGDQDVNFNTHVSNFDIAVSRTSTPTTLSAADWVFYAVSSTEANYDADYPGNFGWNADAFVYTLNMFGAAGHVQVTSISTSALQSGAPLNNTNVFRNDLNDFSVRPTVMHDSLPGDPMWLVTETGDGQHIDVYKMSPVLSNSATFTRTRLTVNTYSGAGSQPPRQPSGGIITSNTDSRIINAAEANNTLVAAHGVAFSGPQNMAQWYQINVASGTPTLTMQGDVGLGNNTYASYPAIDISPSGTIGMVFMDSGTAAGQFVSIYGTGRRPNDPAGFMAAPFLAKAGTGNITDGRLGDLSGISVDSNGSFYGASEWASGSSWSTAIVNFTVGATIISVDASNNLLVNDTVGQNDTLTIQADTSNNRYVVKDPNNLLAVDNSNGKLNNATEVDPHTVWVPFASVAGTTVNVTTQGGNDSLTLDYSLGSFSLPGKQIVYNGAAGVDSLNITGVASFASDAYTATGAGAGSLAFNGFNTVAFSNVESFATLPVAATTTVSIGDGLAHTATMTAGPGAGNDTIAFDGGLDSVTFPNPTSGFVFNDDAGSDTFTMTSLDGGFNAAVTVHGSTGAGDVVTLNAPLVLAGALTIDNAVEATNLNVNVTANSASVGGPTTLGTNATVDTSAANGSIAFAAINDSAANTHTLNLRAGGGAITLGGTVGGTSLLGFTITSAGNASLQAVTAGANGIGVTTSGASGATLNSTLTSAGSITLAGNVTAGTAGAIIHSGANSFSMSGGSLFTGGNTLTVNATTAATTGSIANTITGTGGLAKSGPGTLTLSGANNYSGATTINAGTLQVGAGGATGTLGSSAVTNNGLLVFNRSNALTVANAISGTGGLTQAGAGTTILSGNKSYTGPTTINSGTLEVDNTITSSVTVNSGGALTGNATISGDLSGAGVVSPGVAGPGIMQVSGNVTLSGTLNMDVNEPYLAAGVDYDQIIANGTVDLSNATVNFQGGIATAFSPLTATPIQNNSASSTVTNGSTLPVDGSTIDLGSAHFTFHYNAGDGNDVVLSAIGTGPAIVYVDDDWAGFNSGDPIADADPVAPGNQPATFGTDAFSSVNAALAAVGGNGTIIVNAGTYNEPVAVTRIVTLDLQQGPITFGSLAGTVSTAVVNLNGVNLTTGSNNNSTIFKGLLGGSGGLIKVGNGTMTLVNAANSYTGGTTIDGGIVSVSALADGGANSGIGASSNLASNLVLDGGTLQYTGPAVTSDRLFSVGSSGGTVDASGSGALVFTNAGAIGFNGALGARTLTLTGSATGNTLLPSLGDNGGASTLVKSGAGSWLLTGANTYSGSTTINAGTLQVGNGGTSGALGSGGITDNGSLVFNRSDTVTVASSIGGTGALTQAGAGTLILTGSNTYGATNINAGTLQIGNGGTSGSLGSGAVTDNGALVFNRSDSITIGNAISGTGSLTQAGSGATILTATNSYTGPTSITGGVLSVSVLANGGANSGIGASSNAGGNLVLNGGTLQYTGPVTSTDRLFSIGTAGGTLDASGSGALTFTNTGTIAEPAPGARTLTLTGTNTGGNSLAATLADSNGVSSLAKTGTGTWALTGTSTYSGGTTIVDGTLSLGNGGSTGSIGNGPVVDNGVLAFNRNVGTFIGVAISGTGSVAQVGSGTTVLTANNSYAGTTTISSGTLRVGNNATTGTLGGGDVIDNAILQFDRSDAITVANAISGTGSLSQISNAVVILTGNNSYGPTTISSGTIQIGNGGTSGTLGTGNVTNNGSLIFNRSDALTVGNTIGGAGRLTQAGAGTTTLTATNTYTGSNTLSGGILSVSLLANGGQNSNIGASSNVSANLVFDGGTLQYTGPAVSTDRHFRLTTNGGTIDGSGTGALTFSTTVAILFNGLGPRTLTLTGSALGNTLTPALGDNGGASSLVMAGTGSWILTGTSTYTGTTAITAGTLQVDNGGATGALGSGAVTDNGALVFDRPDTVTVASNINGTGSLTQAGGGTLILTGNNSYGATTIGAGTLQVGNGGTSGTLGTGAVTDNGALVFNRSDTLLVTSDISGNGTLTQAGTGTTILAGTNGYGGGTTITAGTLQIGNGGTTGTLGGGAVIDNGTLAFNRSDALTVANSITGPGALTQMGGGTTILTATNSYTGATLITGGVLSVAVLANGGANSGIGASGSAAASLVLNGGALQYTGPAVTIDRLFSVGNAGGGIDASGSGALTFGNPGSIGFNGQTGARTLTLSGTANGNTLLPTLADNGGASALAETGPGGWILTGNNTYTGPTTITAGTLQVGNGSSGTLGTGPVSDDGSLIFNRSNSLTVGNDISGAGSLTKLGAGTLVLTGTNTYAGTTTITAGTLQVGNAGPTGSLGGGAVLDNAALVFNRTNALTVPNDISGTGGLSQLGTGSTVLTGNNSYGVTTIFNGVLQIGNGGTSGTLGTGVVTDNTNLVFNRSDILVVANALNGPGVLSQSGTGTTILTSSNSYSGGTTITAGTLQVGNAGTTGTLGSGAVTDNGNLAFNRTDAITVSNAINGSGTLTQAGTGTTILIGTNNYSGGTTIAAGTLQVGNAGTTGSVGSGAVLNNSAVVFNRANGLTLGNVISGTGSLTQAGTGALTLTGANGYTGPTTVASGTLAVNAPGSLAAGSAVTVNNSATLAGDGTINGAVTVNAGGMLSPGGTNTGVLSTGSLTLAAGSVLRIDLNTPYTSAGSDYDQVNVTGTVSLAGANLQFVGGSAAGTGAQVLTIVNNDGSDAVSGAAAGLPEASNVAVGLFLGDLTYGGGTGGNDVTLTVPGAAVFTETGGADFVLRQAPLGQVPNQTFNLQLLRNGVIVDSRPLASVTSYTVNGANNANDSLTVDYSFGGVFATPVTFNGGTGGSDRLFVQGGSFNAMTFNDANAQTGSIALDASVVSYAGVEGGVTVTSVSQDTAVNLPTASVQATLQDDAGGVGNGLVALVSNNGTFANATFLVPLDALTVKSAVGTTNHVTTAASFAADYTAGLILAGANDIDTLNGLTLNTGSGILAVTAASITVADAITANAVGLNATTGLNGDLAVNAAVTGSGSVTLSASRDVLITAAIRTVNVAADISAVGDTNNAGNGGVWIQAPNGFLSATGQVTLQGSDIFATGGTRDSVRVDDRGALDSIVATGNITIQSQLGAPGTANVVLDGVVHSTGIGSVVVASKNTLQLSSTLTNPNGGVGLQSPVVLTGDVSVTAGAGGIFFGGTTDADAAFNSRALTLDATGGNITLTGAVGGGQALGSLTVNNAATVTFGGSLTASGDVVQSAGSGTTAFNGGGSIGGLLGIVNGGITVNSATVAAAGGVLFEAANTVTLNAGIDAGAATIEILANQSDSASQGFVQDAAAPITTTNTLSDAVIIIVNFGPTGTASAKIGAIQTGLFGTVSINANRGAILDNNGVANNITSRSLVMNAAGGIGVGDALDTQIGFLRADGGTGGVFLANVGDLTIGGSGAGSALTATAGGIDVSATRNLTVSDAVSAGTAPATLTGGAGGAGNTITLNAAVTGSSAAVLGGSGADVFNVNVTGATNLLVDGKVGSDQYRVLQSAINAAGVAIQDSGGSNGTTDALTSTTGGIGPENIGVTATQVTRDNGGPITYSGIETLNVLGTNGSIGSSPTQVGDLFTISLSTTTVYNLDGLSPTPPNVPGDKLFYNAAGASVNDTGASLLQAGKAAVNYSNFETVQIDNNFLPVTSLTVTGFPTSITAGTPGTFTVTLRDLFGHPATAYRGTVYFSSSDQQAALPSNYTFTSADAGRHTFTATLKTAGTGQVLIAGDTVTPTLFGTQNNITVKPGAAQQLTLIIGGNATAGDALTATVTAQDSFGNAAVYVGTVHFTSSDPQAALPPNYTFTAADAGRHDFSVTLKTAGTQTVTVADTTGAPPSATGTVQVSAEAPSTIVLTGLPANVAAGTASTINAEMRDPFGNLAIDYTGAVHFTSTDPQAVLPADYAFTSADAGRHSFALTLKTAGTQTVTVRDTVSAGLNGSESTTVTPGAASRMTLTLSGGTLVEDNLVVDAAVSLFDSFNNIATGYTGTVHFTSTDPAATLPADYTFVAQDAGLHTFTQAITFFTPGSQTVTTTDTVNAALTATSIPVDVLPPPSITGRTQTFPLLLDSVPLNNTFVATFDQGSDTVPASRYTATIDWGDGTSSPGTIVAGAAGSSYQVLGSHSYEEGTFPITVMVTRGIVSGQFTGSATVKEGLPDGTRGTPNQLFVSELYTDLLGRPVDAGGLVFWTGYLDRGGARANMISIFQTSLEFRKVEVNAAYQAILHRDADDGGKTFFAEFLRHGTVEQLQAVLAGSDEYFQHAGATNTGFLTSLYQDLFHRTLDTGGQTFFTGLLVSQTLNRTQLGSVLMSSPEYFRNTVSGYYQRYLGRAADSGGLNFFSSLLQKGIIRDELLIAFLCATDEYFTRL